MNSSALLVEPAYRSLPGWFDTAGPEVADLARMAGFGPDAEQSLALDALFAFDKSGRSVAFEMALIACRQNLKTGLFKQASLGWLFITDQRLVVWSAHEFSTAQEAFRDMDELVTGTDLLRKRVKNIYRGNGDESIVLTSGARLIFKTRTKGGGRGLTGDKVILDEAFALRPMHMGALLPTLSARPDPQVVYGSSAGLAESDVLRGVRDRGRAGDDPRLAYLEWCAEVECVKDVCDHALGTEGCALDDPAAWARANPTLGKRIAVDYIAAERRALPPSEFARERLGWWDEPASASLAVPVAGWEATSDPDSTFTEVAAFGLDVSPDRMWADIGAVGERAEGGAHLELIAHRPGTAGLVDACVELDRSHGPAPWVIDGSSPAASLIGELEAAGLTVTVLGLRDLGRACVWMVDAVNDGTIRHGPDPILAAAVTAARRKDIGDGLFRFDRRVSVSVISPFMAVTVAAHVLPSVLPLDDVSINFL